MSGHSSKTEQRVLSIVRGVRRRWRLRIALRGLAVVLGTGFLAFLLSAYGLELLRFSPGAVTGARVAAWGAVGVVAFFFLVRPLLRRVTDEQVALYLEEHEPSLEAAILGAVEVEKEDAPVDAGPSPALVRRLVERAVERARKVEYGKRVDQRRLYRASGVLGAVCLAVIAFVFLGPSDLRYGARAVLFPTVDASEVNPYSIVVTPGDVTVARGSDQFITAELRGFASEEVFVFTRTSEGEPFRRLSMLPGDAEDYELLLLDLQEDTDYFVESDGVRSSTHRIEVAELPYVDRMDHIYRLPSYTGLEPRVVEDGGDVAALRGTVVELRIRSTLPTSAGRLLVDDEPVGELTSGEDGILTGEFRVERPGVYEIELARPDGELVSASPEYTIDVLEDLAPSVDLVEPGRDQRASPIEEVYIEARADDDYGVRDVRLAYSVNGGPEDTIALFDGRGQAPLNEVSAGHTLFLEEWGLEAGDVVSYYATARDNRGDESEVVVSDIYFLQVRPFGREYRQAEQQGGGAPMGAGGGGPETALSELQKQVVAATFNLLRDREGYEPGEFSENVVSVALAQGRVKEQVSTLVERMNNRGLAGSDPRFREIAEMLPGAVEDMEEAEERLRDEEPREALGPEQRALRVLQKAEESYERMVSQQQPGGAAGGRQSGAADDLADLFELELDKLRNQYETVQRGERRQADDEVDELLERLKELARRQQQEMERQRRRAEARQGGGGGSGGQAQRELAEQTEEAARRLERLARETGDRDLEETARRLQDAAEAMRRAAASSGRDRGSAEAGSAAEDLEDARRRLERAREERLQNAARDALDRVGRLAQNQDRVQEGLDDLSDDPGERREDLRRLVQRKDQMLGEAEDLERQLDRMAADAGREDEDAARELREAAEAIRESKLKEKIAWSRGVVQERDREYARQLEEQIARDIERLRQETEQAVRATERVTESRSMENALERARDLVRGSESLDRRLRNRPGTEEGRTGEADGDPEGPTENDRGGEPGEEGEARAGQPTPGVGGNPEATPTGGVAGGIRPFTEEEIRQFSREFQERAEEARELRRGLSDAGRDVEDLDEAIRAMEELQDPATYDDLPQITALQETVRESLKRVEFVLRRELEGESRGRAALSGSDEVPSGFRKLVEEYYKSLARSAGGGGGR